MSEPPVVREAAKPKEANGKAASLEALKLEARPEFIRHRLEIFDSLSREYAKELASKPRESIVITLPDGTTKTGTSWETSPANIAGSIAKSMLERTIIAKVDGELWDLDRPLEKSCKLELLDFNHPDGKLVFWHSSAHVLGEASERHFGCHLCNGPPTTDPPGFYYDMANMSSAVQQADQTALEKLCANIIKEKQPFERLVLSKSDLINMFSYSKYKLYFINQRVADGESTTVYRCGPLIDLCRGPHVQHTGRIKAFTILRFGAAYWLGNQQNESLQRIAGISFPDKKQLEEYKVFLAEAAKRNHRKIGTEQKLFFFDEVSPGSCFFLPHGTRIYNAIQELLKQEYRKRGYQEVITPNMYKSDLWKTSGHWDHYSEDMFTFEVEKEKFGLKPMNCPGHCKLFAHSDVSYRDLPWRMADFGVLHRNEFSGALSGLTRVRRFVQDDAHIFCSPSQIGVEIEGVFDFLNCIYGLFGFTFKLKLSTRPEKFIGDIAIWDEAESMLKVALDKFTASAGASWEEKPGDGAFYGPKIDVQLSDALSREHQCGTIQLDFNLPRRFKLRYVAKEKSNPDPSKAGDSTEDDLPAGYERPVMIHRAIVGSFERMIAILIEHFGGKWPFWLSPRQILVVPIMPAVNAYAEEVRTLFHNRGFHADADLGANKFQKKIRTGQLDQYNFIFVVGAEEMNTRTINIRNRDDASTQAKGELVPLDDALVALTRLRDEKKLVTKLEL
ncbi:putative threonyl-tRNA synthetase [Rosellinia necatrix]|uniref:Probable threonine--tRNA ligase, cytoplasmic n=1 Tax=Rosellinia necatrix TaxID=77044 RepID=A0A1W2TWL4_ROSNE|nr:putative threonyl-tRNA synthetase [Rosellinia necatrix]